MEQAYLNLKLTISGVGNNRFRSRIETQSWSGSGFRPGHEFRLTKPKNSSVLEPREFAQNLSAGAISAEQALEFGKWLFRTVFGEPVLIKYEAAKAVAQERGSKLRLCLALDSPILINIPWEFLHDGTNFLLKHGYPIVRVMDELAGVKSSFAPLRNVLIAAANPEGYDQFEPEPHVKELTELLKKTGCQPCVLMPASKDELLKKISSNDFDTLYFVGHGEDSKFEGRLICEKERKPDPLAASRLAQALRDVEDMRFVYLNSCSTAKVASDNPFQGVAQRLMLDGNIAAAVAMQVDVRQRAGLDIAKSFFDNLQRKSAEDALHEARTAAADPFSFGIPVLYTYLDAPQQYRENRLKDFLSADSKSKFALILPSFYMGQPAEDGQPEIPNDGKFRFAGETFADFHAALDVIRLLNPIVAPDQIFVSPLRAKIPPEHTHYFLFGSKSNAIADAVRAEFSKKFEFDYKDKWLLIDKEFEKSYGIDNPAALSLHQYEKRDDYGIVQKIQADDRVYFLIAGLGSRATQGCAWYLYQKWEDHLNDPNLAILLRFPAGLDFAALRVIDRRTGDPRKS